MKLARILRKEFFITLFIKQNNWHKHSVLGHTMKLVYYAIKNKKFNMITAGILHDIGKPIIAFQDEKDETTGEYSFHNHEEISYVIVKNWPISEFSKKLVRYHYLIRGMKKAKEKNQMGKYNRMKRSYESLDANFVHELKIFLKFDDLAKK